MLLKEGVYKSSVIDRILARIAPPERPKEELDRGRKLAGLCYPLGELLDRYAIERRKGWYGVRNKDALRRAEDGLRIWMGLELFEMARACLELGLANADIANLEWQVREGRQLPLEEVGRRALLIRQVNDRRVAAKNRINAMVGDGREDRVYGYGPGLPAEKATLEVQRPAACHPGKP